jgi:hypothetical protein
VRPKHGRGAARAWGAALLLAGCSAADGPPSDGDSDGPPSPPAFDALACLRDAGCDDLLVIAHRGFHRDVPENSLSAIDATSSIGADLVELDVRHTADGALVVLHDAEVDRTTDGVGLVEQLTLAEVRALRLDGGADDDDGRVPTFEEALQRAMGARVGVYVDVKTDRMDLVVAAIEAVGAQGHALVRDDAAALGPAHDAGLMLLAPVSAPEEVAAVTAALPGIANLEIASPVADAALTAAVTAAGCRAQQDVFAGDVGAANESTAGYGAFVEAGVVLMQTEVPDLLVPLVAQARAEGAWPTTWPE